MAKLIREQSFNVGILESYKPATNIKPDSPVLGSFVAKGITSENTLNKNGRKYSTEVWQQPGSFKPGGDYITEDGKLKPATLFGSVDHPLDDRAEVIIQEVGIGWREVWRNNDGTWDGRADILNTPSGRIAKVVLDYAKEVGGGDLIGVSSRAIAESSYVEDSGEQYEAIIPDGFTLKSFDLVFNPSFTNVASMTESTRGRALYESVRSLADNDKEHEEVYKAFLESLKGDNKQMNKVKLEGKSLDAAKAEYLRSLKDREKKLHDMIYDLEKKTPEEFAKEYDKPLPEVLAALKNEYKEIQQAIEDIENPVIQGPRVEQTTTNEGLAVIEGTGTPVLAGPQWRPYAIAYTKPGSIIVKLIRSGEIDLSQYDVNELRKALRNIDSETDPEYIARFKPLRDAIADYLASVTESVKTEDIASDLEELLPDNAVTGNEDQAEEDSEEDKPEESEEDKPEESEEDSEEEEEKEEDNEEEVTLESLYKKISELEELVKALSDKLLPVEDPEAVVGDEDLEELDLDLDDEADLDGELEAEPAEDDDILDDLNEEDLDNLTDEELEYLQKRAKK